MKVEKNEYGNTWKVTAENATVELEQEDAAPGRSGEKYTTLTITEGDKTITLSFEVREMIFGP